MNEIQLMALRRFSLPGGAGEAWPESAAGSDGTVFATAERDAEELIKRGLARKLDDAAGDRETKPATDAPARSKKARD